VFGLRGDDCLYLIFVYHVYPVNEIFLSGCKWWLLAFLSEDDGT